MASTFPSRAIFAAFAACALFTIAHAEGSVFPFRLRSVKLLLTRFARRLVRRFRRRHSERKPGRKVRDFATLSETHVVWSCAPPTLRFGNRESCCFKVVPSSQSPKSVFQLSSQSRNVCCCCEGDFEHLRRDVIELLPRKFTTCTWKTLLREVTLSDYSTRSSAFNEGHVAIKPLLDALRLS